MANDDQLWNQTTYATLAPAVLDLHLKRRLWVHRRVERFEFIADVRVRRFISVDFTMPAWKSSQAAMKVLPEGFVLVPVALLRKSLLRGFDLRDENGSALPVLTLRQNQLLGAALIIGRALAVGQEHGIGYPTNETLTELSAVVVNTVPKDAEKARKVLLETYLKSENKVLLTLAQDEVLVPLLSDLAQHFILCTLLRSGLGERHIIKLSYEDYLKPVPRSGRADGGAIRSQIGWDPVEFEAEVIIGISESSHIEVPAPDELFIERAELKVSGSDSNVAIPTDGPSERIHLHGAFEKPSYGTLRLRFRLQPRGIVTAALLTSLLTAALLTGGLVVRALLHEKASGEAPAAILLALPGVFAAYLFSPGQHRLVRKLFAGLRLVVLAVAILSFAAAGSLAIQAVPGGRTIWWSILTIGSWVAVGIVLTAFLRSRSAESSRTEDIIRP